MSGVTDNYGFITVDEGEAYDEEVFNTNNKGIDAQLKVNELAIKKIKHAEFTGAAVIFPSSAAQWGVGVLTADAPRIFNNTFCAYDSSDKIKMLETGIYTFEWFLSATTLPPAGEVAIRNVTQNDYVMNDDLANGVSYTVPVIATAYVAANDIISFYTFNRTGAFQATSRIKITKVQG